MKKTILSTLILLMSLSVQAQYDYHSHSHSRSHHSSSDVLSSGFYLSVGEMDTIKFSSRYIESIFVQAEGAGSRDAMFEVWANGKPKGTIYVPGRDPNYIVTIKENVRELKFRHISGGNVRVIEVKYDGTRGYSDWNSRPLLGNGYSYLSAQEVSQEALALVQDLKAYANYKDLGAYLLPIRKSAANLYSIAVSRSAYSPKVRAALIQLLREVSMAKAYIDENLETDATFNQAVNLLTIKEKLEAMLGN